MAGVTSSGFERKTREEIERDLKNRARNLFGENINLSDRSPLGKIIKNFAYEISQNWSAQQDVYNSSFVDFAHGQSLDYLAKLIGISRRPANPARSSEPQVFEGDEGVEIPEGFLVETIDGVQFFTVEDVTIDSTNSAEVNIEAVEAGEEGNVGAGEITEITNPISGLSSTNNPAPIVGGRDIESDFELRNRFQDSVQGGGASTADAIRASILKLDAVRDALVVENDTTSTVDGIPPKAFESIVYQGEATEIVETIFDTKAAGIEAYGDNSYTVLDSMGYEHTIKFTRPTDMQIYVDCTITTDDDEFPSGGIEAVEDNIIEYIGGELSNGEIVLGLGLGENVIRTRIIAKVHDIDGITDVTVALSTDGTDYSEANIDIDDIEVANTEPAKVDVVESA